MAHVCQQIREAMATTLTGLAATGSRVYQSRVAILPVDLLPALLVFADDETIEHETINWPALRTHQLDIAVRAVARANADLDDALDDIRAQVETALFATYTSMTLTGLVRRCDLVSVERTLDSDAEVPVGQLTMTFRAWYQTRANAPETAI